MIWLSPQNGKTSGATAAWRYSKLLLANLLLRGLRVARSRLATSVRRTLARRDLLLLNARTQFGVDYLCDIEKLASGWSYTLETLFDVGANDGQTARVLLHRFPNAHVYSFEPHPGTFAVLEQRIGKTRKFRAENLALGTASGSVDMFEYDASVLNSLVPNAPFAVRFKQEARRIAVCCTTLDSYCEERGIERIDILKIDTEGHDLNVLKGGTQILANGGVKFVYVEFNDLHLNDGASGGALLPIDEFLRDYGFRFIASYNDYIVTDGELFSVANALFAAPPTALRRV